jgi:hypothetical protein
MRCVVKRYLGEDGPYVCIYDGRATTTYSWEDFVTLLSNLQAVASGAEDSMTAEMEQEMEMQIAITPLSKADSAAGSGLLATLGLAEKPIKRRKL